MATGHPFCWLIITVCLLAGIFVPGKGAVIGGVAFGSVTICYLILNLIILPITLKKFYTLHLHGQILQQEIPVNKFPGATLHKSSLSIMNIVSC